MNENQLFYFNNNTDIYWHGLIMGTAILLASILFCILYHIIDKHRTSSVNLFIALSFIFSLVFSRLQYCTFKLDEFKTFNDIIDLSQGGFGLYGAFLGTILAVFTVHLIDRSLNIPLAFDSAAVAGSIAICIGRLSAYFSGDELGFELDNEKIRNLFFVTYSKEDNSWLISVYMYEAIVAGIIFAVSVFTFFLVYRKKMYIPGTVAVNALFIYTVTQSLLESWRADSLFLNTLGFVRYSQALSAIIFGIILVFACIKYTKQVGFTKSHIAIWVILLLLIALAFVCEFTMTAGTRTRNYVGMTLGLAGTLGIGLYLINQTTKIKQ